MKILRVLLFGMWGADKRLGGVKCCLCLFRFVWKIENNACFRWLDKLCLYDDDDDDDDTLNNRGRLFKCISPCPLFD